MKNKEGFITFKNILLFTLLMLVLFAILWGIKPDWRGWIEKLVYNPFWPTVIILIDLYFQEKAREIAQENKEKIKSLEGILRTSIEDGNTAPIQPLTEVLCGDNLLEITKEILEQREMSKKIEAAGKIKNGDTNLQP